MKENDGRGQRRITLFCPSLAKLTHIIAWDDHRLDLGSIARVFGLHPNSLKFNGHFISRGVDLVASSVTWRSLIGFFSSRGLSTGVSDSSPLVVDGKLARIGSKKKGQGEASANGNLWLDDDGFKRKNGLEDETSVKRPKSNSWCVEERRGLTSNAVFPCGFMRKTIKRMRDVDDEEDMVAVVSPLKKTR